MRIKAVIFDFFGTLTVAASGEQRAAAVGAIAQAIGAPPVEFRNAWWGTWSERSVGALGDFPAALREIAGRLGLEPSDQQVASAAAIRQGNERRFMQLRGDTISTLEALRARGLRIGLISDCTDDLPQEWPDCPAAPYVDSVIFSFTAKVKKPDPRIYALACDALGVAPGECLYVGDGGSDELTGASAVGMTAVRVQDDGGENHRFEADTWTGAEIATLGELVGGLDGAGARW